MYYITRKHLLNMYIIHYITFYIYIYIFTYTLSVTINPTNILPTMECLLPLALSQETKCRPFSRTPYPPFPSTSSSKSGKSWLCTKRCTIFRTICEKKIRFFYIFSFDKIFVLSFWDLETFSRTWFRNVNQWYPITSRPGSGVARGGAKLSYGCPYSRYIRFWLRNWLFGFLFLLKKRQYSLCILGTKNLGTLRLGQLPPISGVIWWGQGMPPPPKALRGA